MLIICRSLGRAYIIDNTRRDIITYNYMTLMQEPLPATQIRKSRSFPCTVILQFPCSNIEIMATSSPFQGFPVLHLS